MLQADDESLDSRRHVIYFRSQYLQFFPISSRSFTYYIAPLPSSHSIFLLSLHSSFHLTLQFSIFGFTSTSLPPLHLPAFFPANFFLGSLAFHFLRSTFISRGLFQFSSPLLSGSACVKLCLIYQIYQISCNVPNKTQCRLGSNFLSTYLSNYYSTCVSGQCFLNSAEIFWKEFPTFFINKFILVEITYES